MQIQLIQKLPWNYMKPDLFLLFLFPLLLMSFNNFNSKAVPFYSCWKHGFLWVYNLFPHIAKFSITGLCPHKPEWKFVVALFSLCHATRRKNGFGFILVSEFLTKNNKLQIFKCWGWETLAQSIQTLIEFKIFSTLDCISTWFIYQIYRHISTLPSTQNS